MPGHDDSYVVDIYEAAKLVQRFTEGVVKKEFDHDLLRQSAVIRQLEIIGEATKRLSEGFRLKHPGVPWRKMAGMRDILIHVYDHVNIDAVWNVAIVSIPVLIEKLRPFVPRDER